MPISHGCRAGAGDTRGQERWMGDEPRSMLRTRRILSLRLSTGAGDGAMGSGCDVVHLSSVNGEVLPLLTTMER